MFTKSSARCLKIRSRDETLCANAHRLIITFCEEKNEIGNVGLLKDVGEKNATKMHRLTRENQKKKITTIKTSFFTSDARESISVSTKFR